jgi:anti-sigma factor ChrR (cupin superfamily)
MHLRDDFARREVIDTTAIPWVSSPGGHVERRMLDRTGAERARATSIVRYAAESRFPAHEHGGGEEFLVLAGTFSDDDGDFPAGWYVRNPVGSRHAPRSAPGCVIFVKLWWMHAADQAFVRIDTIAARPEDAGRNVGVVSLHRFADESAAILHLAPGAVVPERALPGGEEFLVLSGTCHDEGGTYTPMTWSRHPPGHASALTSATGARLFVKRGHLSNPPAPPG